MSAIRSGRFQAAFALRLDTTERERALSSYRALSKHLPGAAYRFTVGGGTSAPFVDESITRMTGYAGDEIRGSKLHPIYYLVMPGYRKRLREAIRAALVSMSPFKVEYAVRHRNGQVRRLLDFGWPVAVGELQQIGGVILDITEQKRLAGELRRAQFEVHRLSTQLAVAQEVERAAIARELHDGISQSLVGLQIRLRSLLRREDAGHSKPQAAALADLLAILEHAIEDLRRVSAGLRPAILDDLSLLPALEWLSREFRAISPDIELRLDMKLQASEIPQAIATCVYRIVQESLGNVSKHARASEARVALARSGNAIVLEISDNGSGFDPQVAMALGTDADQKHGFGLRNIRQRVLLSGGKLSIRSDATNGTTIRVQWPSDR